MRSELTPYDCFGSLASSRADKLYAFNVIAQKNVKLTDPNLHFGENVKPGGFVVVKGPFNWTMWNGRAFISWPNFNVFH